MMGKRELTASEKAEFSRKIVHAGVNGLITERKGGGFVVYAGALAELAVPVGRRHAPEALLR
jgi:hypothetical protein